MKKTFFIDLDDTLLPNQHYYKIQLAKVVKLIINTVYPREREARAAAEDLLEEAIERGYRVPPLGQLVRMSVDDESGLLERILAKEEEIDLRLLKRAKGRGEPYNRHRFPTSCRSTYLHFCRERGIEPDLAVAREAYAIGAKFWDIKPGLMWSAAQVLDFLVEKGDELHILTKGDRVVQRHKLEVNRLERWIPEENWHIVNDKDPVIFRKWSRGMDLRRVYMVGNSQKSDINPAIEAGANGIYVPFYTWVHEESDEFSVGVKDRYALDARGELLMLETGRKLFILPNIKDIMDLYEDL